MISISKLRDFSTHNLFKFHMKHPSIRLNLIFNEVYEAAKLDESILIEAQYQLEYGVKETGDHAVEWVFYYHTKDVDKLLLTRQHILLLMLETSIEKGISLSTPITINNS